MNAETRLHNQGKELLGVIKTQSDQLRDAVELLKTYREALEEISKRERLRDRSMLASNPMQNSAVWDIQIISKSALSRSVPESLKEILK